MISNIPSVCSVLKTHICMGVRPLLLVSSVVTMYRAKSVRRTQSPVQPQPEDMSHTSAGCPYRTVAKTEGMSK